MLPTLRYRRQIHKYLSAFFESHQPADFNRAVSSMCRFFKLKRPKVEWFEYLDWGRAAGNTYSDGKIFIWFTPENWKKGRKYNSEAPVASTPSITRMGHYVFLADAERKAGHICFRMAKGVNGNHRNGINGMKEPWLNQRTPEQKADPTASNRWWAIRAARSARNVRTSRRAVNHRRLRAKFFRAGWRIRAGAGARPELTDNNLKIDSATGRLRPEASGST
jgi:hypothetical protein